MTGCKTSCLHRRLVAEYRLYVEAWELQAEAAANGWATEYEEYAAAHPRPTFKEWLIGHRTEQDIAS